MHSLYPNRAIPAKADITLNETVSKIFLSGVIFLLFITSVNAQTIRGEDLLSPTDVPDEIFGYNGEYMIDQCLDAEGDFDIFTPMVNVQLDQTCRELVDEINPGVIRFPGGTTANYYHFNGTGYGYDASETFGTNLGLGELALDDVVPLNFIELFADLVLQTGSKVIFTMNLFTHFKPGGASINNPNSDAYQRRFQENLDALDYLMGRGVDVIAVELGNELYFEWELTGLFTLYFAVDKYLRLAEDYALAINAAYPDIEIGIPAALVNSNFEFNYWNTKMQEADFADGVVIHEYNRNVQDYCNPNVSREAYFDCALQQVDEFQNNKLNELIDDYMALYPDKDLWLTEWGISNPDRISNTFLDAYSVFGNLNNLAELLKQHPGQISYANRHNLLTGGYHYPAFGTKFLNESDDLIYNGNKAIRASAYPAFLMTEIIHGENQYIGYTTINNCKAWLYTKEAGGYYMAVCNNTGTPQSINMAELESMLELSNLEIDRYSALSAGNLYDAAGINYYDQNNQGLVNNLNFVEDVEVNSSQRAQLEVDGYSLNVLTVVNVTPPPPPPPVNLEIFLNINPTITFSNINVKVTVDSATDAELMIVNAGNGNVVHQESIQLNEGFNSFQYNMDNFSATGFGVYRVVLNYPNGIKERSFIYLG